VKKIIFTVTNDLSYDQRMIRICSTLATAGYEVELVGRKRRSSVPLPERPFRQTRLACRFEKGKLFYIWYNLRLFFFLLFKKADIISAVDQDTLLPCTLVARIRSLKLVFDAHEYFTEVPEVVHRPFTKKIWHWVSVACAPHAHAAYTVNQSLATIFTKEYGKPFSVIRSMPFATPAPPAEPTQERIILYQGDLNEGRGIEHLIRSMQKIDAVVWIAGKGPLREELEQLRDSLQLGYKVKFIGSFDPAELHNITRQARIGINLFEARGLSYHYSLANKFFDYIQAGIPQLCADLPEYRAINEQYEVAALCACDDKQITCTLNNLLQDAAFYNKLRSATLQARKVYTWEQEAPKLLAIYESL
jgi:glycosyltransferase involved in cell wall biosynthesis